MKKTIYSFYALCAGGLAILALYQCLAFRNKVVEERPNESYIQITEYDSSVERDAKSPIGTKIMYRFLLDRLPEGNNSLMFYTIHQNVRVLLDGEIIYSVQPYTKNSFGKSPGNLWHAVSLYREDIGKEIVVELLPSYKSSSNIVPDIYIGARLSLWKNMLLKNSISLLLSILAFIVGITFIVVGFFGLKNQDGDWSLLMLGAFSVCISVWQITDSQVLCLLFPKSIAFASLPFIALMMVSIPFVLFMRAHHSEKEHMIWNVPCVASLIEIGLVTMMQLTRIADFRETLWMTHSIMLLSVSVIACMVFRDVVRNGWTLRMKLNVGGMGGCFVGLLIDIIFFYSHKGTTVMFLGMTLFLVYIIVIGFLSVKEARELISIGNRARTYEEMAFHDQLTGLYNRTAYSVFTSYPDFEPENHIVVMFDLNNLKKCNDTLGHQMGDVYIRDSAKLIQEAFGELGKCYRMGGDEFSALLQGCPLAKCKKRAEYLQEAVKKYNQTSENITMGIACGFEMFDKRIDYDLGDTQRRADKVMYRQKFMMKQEIADAT